MKSERPLKLRRWQNSPSRELLYDSVSLANINAFLVYGHKKFAKKAARQLLEPRVTKPEFDFAKKQILLYFQQTLDVVNWVDSLEWFSGFAEGNYWGIADYSPLKIYQFFHKIKYQDFQKYMASLRAAI